MLRLEEEVCSRGNQKPTKSSLYSSKRPKSPPWKQASNPRSSTGSQGDVTFEPISNRFPIPNLRHRNICHRRMSLPLRFKLIFFVPASALAATKAAIFAAGAGRYPGLGGYTECFWQTKCESKHWQCWWARECRESASRDIMYWKRCSPEGYGGLENVGLLI